MGMTENQASLSDQVFHQILTLLRYARQHGRQLIDARGITPRDFSVLRHLRDSSCATVGQIQAFLHNSPSTTSALIAQLEENGYVTRRRSQKDNRVVIVALTPLGEDIADNTPLGGLPLLRRRLGQLSEKRLGEVGGVLTEIMQLMEAVEAE
jgi:DNA-binding MarR family transcriptional regulator